MKSGLFNQYRWLISRIQWVLDGMVVVMLLLLTCRAFHVPFQREFPILGIITFILTLMVFQSIQLYRPWRGVNVMELIRKVFMAWIIVSVLLLVIGFFSKTYYLFPRKLLVSWLVLTPLALVGMRLMVYLGLHWARSCGMNSRSVVIAGAGDLGQRLAKNVVDTPWLGMKLIGFFDDKLTAKNIPLEPGDKNIPILGNLNEMAEFVREHGVDMVYLALPLRAENRVREIVEALQDTTTSVYFAPDVFIFSLLQATPTDLRGIPLISLWETPFCGINSWIKRAEDMIIASIIVIFIFPLVLLIALGVKLSSPGPILFKQRRYGLDGKEILVYKFRTMKVIEDGPEIAQATRNDFRITRFGGFLRRTSLDEIPQFFNVLQGNMSIVGPRPHAIAHNEYYRQHIPGYMLRHKIRPGVTGWAQINGWRGETETLEKMEKRIKYDLEYLLHWSVGFDLKIIFLTPFLALRDPKAY